MPRRSATRDEVVRHVESVLQSEHPHAYRRYTRDLAASRADPVEEYLPENHEIRLGVDFLVSEPSPEPTPAPEGRNLRPRKRVRFSPSPERTPLPEAQPSDSEFEDWMEDEDYGFNPPSDPPSNQSSPLSSLGSRTPTPPPRASETAPRSAHAQEPFGPDGTPWPCLPCMKSVAHGRGLPICQSAGGRAKRCSHCVGANRGCEAGPPHARPFFIRAIEANRSGDKKLYLRLQAALKLVLELEDDEPGWFDAGRSSEAAEKAKIEKACLLAEEIKNTLQK